MRLSFCLSISTVVLLATFGCTPKNSATSTQDSAKSTIPAGEDPDAKLLTTEALETKLKGKSAKEVSDLLGEPSRQYGMESGAGRMVYDKKIAKDTKLGKSVSGTVWFARDVVDNVAFNSY